MDLLLLSPHPMGERGIKRFTPVPSSLLPSGERGMDLLLLSPHLRERMKERGHDEAGKECKGSPVESPGAGVFE